jgi:hypothetical protein
LCARFTAAPGTAVLCWLFLNGFAIPPTGTLTFPGQRDTSWLACLLAATLIGSPVVVYLVVLSARRLRGQWLPALGCDGPTWNRS